MLEVAKAKGELLVCGCCYEDQFLEEDVAACDDGHIFCKACIKKGAEVEIGNGKTKLPCLMDCGYMISLQTLKGILQPSVFRRLEQRIQIEEVKAAGIEDFETCPFCDFGMIPSRDDKVFKCLNPECMKDSCRLCKEISHIPLRCDEVEKSEEVKLRTYIEDRMTEALVRTCRNCKKKFIKEDGCNLMTCTCGARMCYLCHQPVEDHWHFFAQGDYAIEKCALYSDSDQLHVDAVREEAMKAKAEVESKNPQLALKHDPTKILPTAQATKIGYPDHRYILNQIIQNAQILERGRGHIYPHDNNLANIPVLYPHDNHPANLPVLYPHDNHPANLPVFYPHDNHPAYPPVINPHDNHPAYLPLFYPHDNHPANPPDLYPHDNHPANPPDLYPHDNHPAYPPLFYPHDNHPAYPPLFYPHDNHPAYPPAPAWGQPYYRVRAAPVEHGGQVPPVRRGNPPFVPHGIHVPMPLHRAHARNLDLMDAAARIRGAAHRTAEAAHRTAEAAHRYAEMQRGKARNRPY